MELSGHTSLHAADAWNKDDVTPEALLLSASCCDMAAWFLEPDLAPSSLDDFNILPFVPSFP